MKLDLQKLNALHQEQGVAAFDIKNKGASDRALGHSDPSLGNASMFQRNLKGPQNNMF